jgi:hypothetical protein
MYRDDGSTALGVMIVVIAIASFGLGYHARSIGIRFDIRQDPITQPTGGKK